MNTHGKAMTVDEMDKVDELHDAIDDLFEGRDFSVCLHAVCATIAGAGANVKDASKQEFMASVHEAISSWYDYYQDILKN
jgi:transcription elongation factor GreA-like protein